MAKYAIGLDYGTLSVRALLLNIETGEEAGVSVYEYPHGVMDRQLTSGEKLPANWALQEPQDYFDGLIYTVNDVMKKADILPKEVIGIGVDFTASTILPVLSNGLPLCHTEEFKREPHAYVKLWKHHGGECEAEYINKLAIERKEKWLKFYGGKVSSEWMIPKVLETLHHAPEVYEKADRFMEALDWIIWMLTGEESRSVCGLGYKTFYHHKMEYPSKEFFKAVDLNMKDFVEKKLAAPIKKVGERAGVLTEAMAKKLGLIPGTPIGTGIIDAHASLLGSGIAASGEMMIVMGTSSCHLLLSEKEVGIPGVGGCVKDGILPGYFAYEAGQSCVGDLFAWFTNNCIPERYESEAKEKEISIHQLLVEKLEGYHAGQSGLLALDWFNGVRSPLMNFNLNGMIMGMNLQTKPEELYLALIEATAYGTRLIIEQFEQEGLTIDSVVLSGGIPMKNPMLVQVYADVLNRDIKVSGTTQACALGAAILGTAAASEEVSGYKDVKEIVAKLGKEGKKIYHSKEEHVKVYDELYMEYKNLYEYFGKGMNDIMMHLNKIRGEYR